LGGATVGGHRQSAINSRQVRCSAGSQYDWVLALARTVCVCYE